MPKKKDQVFYQLTVTEKQLRLINTALEEYFRIGMNQWGNLADRLAMIGVDLSPENPNHKYKEIAETLGVPESTVRSWATRYWKKGKVATEKVASKKKKVATDDATKPPGRARGGQPGNVNSVGNKGGSAPPGNQNNFKHGGYAAILFDTLDEQEQSLIGQMEPNEEQYRCRPAPWWCSPSPPAGRASGTAAPWL